MQLGFDYARFPVLIANAVALTAIEPVPPSACADVLVGTNGERFIGTVIEVTTNLVFWSEIGGFEAMK
jgi:hypothetical protein